MRILYISLILCVVLVYVVSALSVNICAGKPLIVCSTSVLGSVVRDLAGDLVEVRVIASPTICPAHYDIRPGDVEAVAKASLIFYHGFEPWIERLVKASGSKAPLVKISGPWNTPPGLKRYYTAVASALKSYLGIDVSGRLSKCLSAIDRVAKVLREAKVKYGFGEVKVICMQWQVAFVKYLGFNIVAIYPPPEKISLSEAAKLEKIAKSEHVALIIDNLQSGVEFGRRLAKASGAIHVVLTNFPESEPGLNNVTMVYLRNLKVLVDAVRLYRLKTYGTALKSEVESLKFRLRLFEGLTIVFIVSTLVLGLLLLRYRKAGG